MRRGLIAVALFGSLLLTPVALAQEKPKFPDLPGMGLAEDAAQGKVAPSGASRHGDAGAAGPQSKGDRVSSSEAPDPAPVAALPGAGALPAIPQQNVDSDTDLTVERSPLARLPIGVQTFAAVGTLLSLGGYLALRRALAL